MDEPILWERGFDAACDRHGGEPIDICMEGALTTSDLCERGGVEQREGWEIKRS